MARPLASIADLQTRPVHDTTPAFIAKSRQTTRARALTATNTTRAPSTPASHKPRTRPRSSRELSAGTPTGCTDHGTPIGIPVGDPGSTAPEGHRWRSSSRRYRDPDRHHGPAAGRIDLRDRIHIRVGEPERTVTVGQTRWYFAAIVAITWPFFVGSIFDTVGASSCETQSAPSPNASVSGACPTGRVAITRPLVGSILNNVFADDDPPTLG